LSIATALHLITNKEREFPLIRLCGTLGWIAAGILVSRVLHADTTAIPMYIAGAASLLMGLYSFTLPNVPPPGAGQRLSWRGLVGLDVLSQLRSRTFVVFILGVLFISIPLATYFPYVPPFLRDAGVANPAFKMTFGQMSEILFLLLLPWFFSRWGAKWVLIAGMSAWILRYTLFAIGAPDAITWMLILAICLHGPCYDFVYVAGQVFIDKLASPAVRAQAQGLFVLATYGVGQGLGTLAAGEVFNRVLAGATGTAALPLWQTFWIIPLVFFVLVTVMFVAGFKEESSPRKAAAVAFD
jgi:nucleoside transporter